MNLIALIHVYNGDETILFTLESLLGKVDKVIILDGRWIGVECNSLHSTDKTYDVVKTFMKDHPILPIIYLYATKPMHQVESRQYLLDQVPNGDWVLMIDSDEIVINWIDNLKEKILKTTKEKYFVVHGKYHRVRLGTVRLMCKSKGLFYERNHRWMSDKNGKILLGNLERLPIQIRQHSLRVTKKMREPMKKYEKWLWDWENK